MAYRCKNRCRLDGVYSKYEGHEYPQGQRLKERFKSNFKINNKTKLCGSKKEHKNEEQEHEMCKINMKMNIYCANIWKHEHEKNMRRLWCKIVPKINVKQIKGNDSFISIYILFGDLVQRSF
jgi:hypothetical protein